ncbi:MAG: hypothetical protein R3Y38_03920 [Rikenellaceae bacterium]
MENLSLLQGKWEFIGQEIFNKKSKLWIEQGNFSEQVTWNFNLNFASQCVEYGKIDEESVVTKTTPMQYSYNSNKQRLIVDADVQDKYKIEFTTEGIMVLEILTINHALPYMRYLLRRL